MLRHKVRSRCRKVQGMLSEYVDSALSHEERSVVEQHLEMCGTCSRELESLQMTVQMLHRVPAVQTPRSFAITQVEPSAASIFDAQNLRWLRPATAFAAIALMLLLSVDFLVVGGGELPAVFVPAPGEETGVGGEMAGDTLLEASPAPTFDVEGRAPAEKVGPDEPEFMAPGDVRSVPGAEGGGWPFIRQVEVAIGVAVFVLLSATAYTGWRRRAWRGI